MSQPLADETIARLRKRLASVERERDEARAIAVAVDDLVSDMAGPEYTAEDEYREMRDAIKAWRKAGAR